VSARPAGSTPTAESPESIVPLTAFSPLPTNARAGWWPASSPASAAVAASPSWPASPGWIATRLLADDVNCAGLADGQVGFVGPVQGASASKKSPEVLKALEELLQDTVAGDPVSGLKWTHRSLRKLQKALRRRCRVRLALATIARLLRDLGFSLKTCRKQQAGLQDPDRDRQFRYIARMRKLYLGRGLPVISVDTKKKELVGNFKNPGHCWRKHCRSVLDHDYPSWALGQAIPVGIYDVGSNDGYVVVGTAHGTAAFIAAVIGRWWRAAGRHRYAGARRLLLQMDGGGANDPRKWLWKVALQQLADETGLVIVVTHYPPGASKWNLIEHRMFSQISRNWFGEPLDSYERIVKYIRTTRTESGFHCRAHLDRKDYPMRQRVAAAEKARIRLKPHRVLARWNYTIWPHRSHGKC
jgi:hypothetical protein